MNDFCYNNFINKVYATEGRSVNQEDYTKGNLNNNYGLLNIGATYWFATGNNAQLRGVERSGSVFNTTNTSGNRWSRGVRPVITLKVGLQTYKNKIIDAYGNSAWELIPPQQE